MDTGQLSSTAPGQRTIAFRDDSFGHVLSDPRIGRLAAHLSFGECPFPLPAIALTDGYS